MPELWLRSVKRFLAQSFVTNVLLMLMKINTNEIIVYLKTCA